MTIETEEQTFRKAVHALGSPQKYANFRTKPDAMDQSVAAVIERHRVRTPGAIIRAVTFTWPGQVPSRRKCVEGLAAFLGHASETYPGFGALFYLGCSPEGRTYVHAVCQLVDISAEDLQALWVEATPGTELVGQYAQLMRSPANWLAFIRKTSLAGPIEVGAYVCLVSDSEAHLDRVCFSCGTPIADTPGRDNRQACNAKCRSRHSQVRRVRRAELTADRVCSRFLLPPRLFSALRESETTMP